MYPYILRRLLLIIPTLLGIMVINFVVIQFVPGGPVEQMIAQLTGDNVEATARFGGGSPQETRDTSQSLQICLLYTSPSPRDKRQSRMPSSA